MAKFKSFQTIALALVPLLASAEIVEDDISLGNPYITDSSQTESNKSKSKKTQSSKSDSNDPTESYELSKQVVTASGYAQDIKDAPATITVIEKEEIMTRPIRDIGDAVQDVPGVYTEKDKTGQSTISMRGMSSSYTLILIDGKRQNTTSSFISSAMGNTTSFIPPLSMIERIEVIRGPASIIYGSEAMGGVINIITKKMDNEFHSGFQLEADFFEPDSEWGNMYGGNAYISTPIKKDKLFFNARVSYKDNEQNAFTTPTQINSNPYATHSSTGSYQVNAGFRLGYVATKRDYIYLDADVYEGRMGSLNTSSSHTTVVADLLKIGSTLSHEGKYAWGNLSSYVQYAYNAYAGHNGVSTGANKGTSINWPGDRINQQVVYQTTYNNDFDLNRFGAVIFNGGIYYFYDTMYNTSASGAARNIHRNQFALFGEGQYIINRYFTTTFGLRANFSDSYSPALNPRLFFNYNPTNWLTLKAGISSGMLAGSLTQTMDGCYTSRGNTYCGNPDLKPESSWNYEISAIADMKYIELLLTGYYTDFNNQIITQQASSTYKYYNVSRSLVTGAEFGFKLKPVGGFGLDASYAYTYTEALSDENQPKGSPINNIPRHNVTLKPSYRYKNFDAYIRWSGKFETPISPTTKVGSSSIYYRDVLKSKYFKDYQVVDIAATYRIKKIFALTFAVNNLFDVDFMDYVSYSSNGSSSSGYLNRYQRILPSRNYWVTFKADF